MKCGVYVHVILLGEPYMCKRVRVYLCAQLKHAIALAKAMDMHTCVRLHDLYVYICVCVYGMCFHV